MDLFANPSRPDHAENNAAFRKVIRQFPELNLFHPAPVTAPWHVQAVIDGASPVKINFWPHVLKAQIDGEKSVCGEAQVANLIARAFREADEEPFEVIE